MMSIRAVKTSSGSIAVQVVRYLKRRRIIEAHIGSARNEDEVIELKKSAQIWINRNNKQQLSLFPESDCDDTGGSSSLISLDKCHCLGFRYQLFYDTIWSIGVKLKFHLIENSKILNDLVITRLIFPNSKLESFEFMSDYFGIKHHRTSFYRQLENKGIVELWKNQIESRVITAAKKHFGFNFSLVFYDLTTLYFESEKDEDGGLRKIGFSKDNKPSNPQIMIGLLVNDLGFPVSYQLFSGNKFEGHTLAPSINLLKKKYKIKNLTVVADSAMMSEDNFKFLRNEKFNYIVAARTANLSPKLIAEIAAQLKPNLHDEVELKKQDEETIRIKAENKGDLILNFSIKRYQKEKREMQKQLEKADYYLKHPNQAEIIKRTKFLKGKKLGYELNQDLINKTTQLLGIKGYYTSLSEDEFSNEKTIEQYKNLWKVEQNFRISKSDLKTRPIFHSKQQSIEVHILICFAALAIAKYIEIKTRKSIRFVTKQLKKAADARIYSITTSH